LSGEFFLESLDATASVLDTWGDLSFDKTVSFADWFNVTVVFKGFDAAEVATDVIESKDTTNSPLFWCKSFKRY
jgi:hypothetical protein